MGKFVEQCEISYLDNILSEIHPTWEHKYTQAPKPQIDPDQSPTGGTGTGTLHR